jgi:hypothetical protein
LSVFMFRSKTHHNTRLHLTDINIIIRELSSEPG